MVASQVETPSPSGGANEQMTRVPAVHWASSSPGSSLSSVRLARNETT
jgi:hypothetical protein